MPSHWLQSTAKREKLVQPRETPGRHAMKFNSSTKYSWENANDVTPGYIKDVPQHQQQSVMFQPSTQWFLQQLLSGFCFVGQLWLLLKCELIIFEVSAGPREVLWPLKYFNDIFFGWFLLFDSRERWMFSAGANSAADHYRHRILVVFQRERRKEAQRPFSVVLEINDLFHCKTAQTNNMPSDVQVGDILGAVRNCLHPWTAELFGVCTAWDKVPFWPSAELLHDWCRCQGDSFHEGPRISVDLLLSCLAVSERLDGAFYSCSWTVVFMSKLIEALDFPWHNISTTTGNPINSH